MRRKEKYWSRNNGWKKETKGDGKAKDWRKFFGVGRKKETRWKEDVCGMKREERKERERARGACLGIIILKNTGSTVMLVYCGLGQPGRKWVSFHWAAGIRGLSVTIPYMPLPEQQPINRGCRSGLQWQAGISQQSPPITAR